MDFPFDEVEGTVTSRGEGIATGDSLSFRSRACSYEIDAHAAIRRRAGKHDLAREVLLSHPAQVFIEADVPCVTRLQIASESEIPHLAMLEVISNPDQSAVASNDHRAEAQ
jgi:hypothetical protein